MSEVIRGKLNGDEKHNNIKLVVVFGSNHAEEVAKDVPTTIVSACIDLNVAEYVQDIFMNPYMRLYTSIDRTGIELCGAFKILSH